VTRAAAIAALGLSADTAATVDQPATSALGDDSPRVRSAAIGALVRAGSSSAAESAWTVAIDDPAPDVRRRAAELAPALARRRARDEPVASPLSPPLVGRLVGRLGDEDTTVVEAAAYAIGELGPAALAAGAVTALAATATGHDDPLAREAAVAALGALGDPAGLPAVLAACRDKVTVRRRAVLALAPFDGPEVDEALARALTDRDWQVRQAAEDLTTSS